MEFKLKSISTAGIPEAISKASRVRRRFPENAVLNYAASPFMEPLPRKVQMANCLHSHKPCTESLLQR